MIKVDIKTEFSSQQVTLRTKRFPFRKSFATKATTSSGVVSTTSASMSNTTDLVYLRIVDKRELLHSTNNIVAVEHGVNVDSNAGNKFGERNIFP